MARTLIYGDSKGAAEGIRYILHYGGLEFEDVRIPRDEFPKVKDSLNLPFGKVPVYKEGDKVLNQSQVIAKYIAKQVGLVPDDPWEEAYLETVPHTLGDYGAEMRGYFYEQDPEKKEEIKKKVAGELFEFYFSRFEKRLVENNGHFGNKLSWVDLTFVALLDTLIEYFGVNFDKYPKIKELSAEVKGLKGIKEYIEKSSK